MVVEEKRLEAVGREQDVEDIFGYHELGMLHQRLGDRVDVRGGEAPDVYEPREMGLVVGGHLVGGLDKGVHYPADGSGLLPVVVGGVLAQALLAGVLQKR